MVTELNRELAKNKRYEYDRKSKNTINMKKLHKDVPMFKQAASSEDFNAKVIVHFPESSDNDSTIIGEVRLILLDIFQKNLETSFTSCTYKGGQD